MATNHYVYRITNIKLNKYYYGVRTSKIDPKLDLGATYFSSSLNKDFIQDQKENSQDYKYKIIGIFKTRKLAMNFEIKLHNKFNVGINESFYNRAKAAINGFSIAGLKGGPSIEKWRKSMEKIGPDGLNSHQRIQKKNKQNMKKIIQKSNLTKLANVYESGLNINQRNGLKHSKTMKIKYMTGEMNSRGKHNSNAKRINIYDENGQLIFKSYGNFREICLKNRLPFNSLKKSYQHNSNPIYSDIKNGNCPQKYYEYKGWYAQEIK